MPPKWSFKMGIKTDGYNIAVGALVSHNATTSRDGHTIGTNVGGRVLVRCYVQKWNRMEV